VGSPTVSHLSCAVAAACSSCARSSRRRFAASRIAGTYPASTVPSASGIAPISAPSGPVNSTPRATLTTVNATTHSARASVGSFHPTGQLCPYHAHCAIAADLAETLYRGLADNYVGRIITTLLRNDLIFIDEVGFAPLDHTGAQLLFRVVAAAYERRSLGIASHWPFDQWGRLEHPEFGGDSILPRCSRLGGCCLPRYRRLTEPQA
jgi:hypothetical protein